MITSLVPGSAMGTLMVGEMSKATEANNPPGWVLQLALSALQRTHHERVPKVKPRNMEFDLAAEAAPTPDVVV